MAESPLLSLACTESRDEQCDGRERLCKHVSSQLCRYDVLSGTAGTLTIDLLPEDVLLEIFDFCKLASSSPSWGWHRLIHVSRQWRSIVFASRHRLDLRLFCTYGTPVRKTLDCWPPLPLVIRYSDPTGHRPPSPDDDDNIIAALQHRDRVCEVELTVGSSLFAKLSSLMQEPFPLLESLTLRPRDNNVALALPSTFLGPSAPRLRNLCLDAIVPPVSPTFLPSSEDLVCLRLQRVPGDAYISPDALLAGLAAMTQLKILCVQFATQTTPPYLTSTPPSPLIRPIVLPALSYFEFRGTNEFLEDLVARIGATPSLARTYISVFDHPAFEIPQFAQFAGRAAAQRISPCEAKILLHKGGAFLSLSGPKGGRGSGGMGEGTPGTSGSTGTPHSTEEWLRLHVSCVELGRQVPSMAQICRQISPLLSGVRKLEIVASVTPLSPQDVADASQWVGLFHMFGGVEKLHVSYGSVPDVARALQHVARERASEVLPALRELHFDWFASRWEEAVASFIAARHSSHPPITFHRPKIALA